MKPTDPKPEIRSVIVMGDSLSERGTFYYNHYFLRKMSGLDSKSRQGRFTTGFVWSDYLATMMASKLIVNDLKRKYHWDSTDIADAVLSHSPKVTSRYSLKDDQAVTLDSHDIMRNYSEAGLTAHNYHWFSPNWNASLYTSVASSLDKMRHRLVSCFQPRTTTEQKNTHEALLEEKAGDGYWISSTNWKVSFCRNIVSTLDIMRERLFKYDKTHGVTDKQKEQTLVIVWCGANDMLVANEVPSTAVVDKAIAAQVKNIKELMDQGYRHFMVFNVPDFLLTPRYHNKNERERELAKECCMDFNNKLHLACQDLRALRDDSSLYEFDINSVLTHGRDNPELYGLDPLKINTPYLKSEDFKAKIPAKGYIFWDGLHFTSHIHSLVGDRVYSILDQRFTFCSSPPLEENSPKKNDSINKWAGALFATSATAIGLNKLGVSSRTFAAGVGAVAALSIFAPKLKGIQMPSPDLEKVMAKVKC